MSATARNRIIALVESISPNTDAGMRFRRSDRRRPLDEYPGQSRLFELSDPAPSDYGLTGPTPSLFVEDLTLRVRYEAGPRDRETIEQQAARDLRDIVRTLAHPTNWQAFMNQLTLGERPERRPVLDTGGVEVAFVYEIPLQIQYYETS